jgi:hypothetical protein
MGFNGDLGGSNGDEGLHDPAACSMMQVSSWPTVSTLIFHHHVTVMVSSDDPKLYQNILSNDLEFRTS